MLEFSSLSLGAVVVTAARAGDTAMHSAWLALTCSSLIHHASGRRRRWVRAVDRALCWTVVATCAHRLRGKSVVKNAVCYGAAALVAAAFKHRDRHAAIHATMHVLAAGIGVLSVQAGGGRGGGGS